MQEEDNKIISKCLSFSNYYEIELYLSGFFKDDLIYNYNFESFVWKNIRGLGIENEVIDFVGSNFYTGESEIGYVKEMKTTADIFAGILHFLFVLNLGFRNY